MPLQKRSAVGNNRTNRKSASLAEFDPLRPSTHLPFGCRMLGARASRYKQGVAQADWRRAPREQAARTRLSQPTSTGDGLKPNCGCSPVPYHGRWQLNAEGKRCCARECPRRSSWLVKPRAGEHRVQSSIFEVLRASVSRSLRFRWIHLGCYGVGDSGSDRAGVPTRGMSAKSEASVLAC